MSTQPRGIKKKVLKGVGMPWVKKMISVVSKRVAQDKLFGVGMTLLRPRVCPLDTILIFEKELFRDHDLQWTERYLILL